MGSSVQRWAFRLVTASVITGALAYIPYRVAGSDGYMRYRRMQKESAELSLGNETLRRENRALHRDVRGLRDDLEVIAQVARDELGMVAQNELVVRVRTEQAPVAPAIVSKAP